MPRRPPIEVMRSYWFAGQTIFRKRKGGRIITFNKGFGPFRGQFSERVSFRRKK